MNQWPSWWCLLAAVALTLVTIVAILAGAGMVAWLILFGL